MPDDHANARPDTRRRRAGTGHRRPAAMLSAAAIGTASALLVTLTPALVEAAPAYQKPRPKPQVFTSVPGTVARPLPQAARTAISATARPASRTELPGQGSAQVTLVPGKQQPVPGLPVALTALPGDAATGAREPGAPAGALPVTVTTPARTVGATLGLTGPVFVVSGSGAAPLKVDVTYGDWDQAVGGDWASRLQAVSLPACALVTPQAPACRSTSPLTTSNDTRTRSVTFTLPGSAAGAAGADSTDQAAPGPAAETRAGGPARVFALSSTTGGLAGDYAATNLSPASTWQVSDQTGDFTWSYPFRVPPAVNGPSPSLALSYSSGSVDGRVASTNNQPSWVGEGHTLEPGYVERRYVPCAEDMTGGNNSTRKTGDLCWRTDNATVVLAGHSSELVRDSASGAWRLRDDDGSKIERLTTGANADNDHEMWVLTTQDGTRYAFGQGLRGPADTGPNSNATWTVPVAGNHTGEPCRATGFGASFCTQAWRWNLDHVADTHGNTMSYYYNTETNNYGRNNGSLKVNYVRGGWLDRIEYGERAGSEHTTDAPARVLFGTAERCLPNGTVTCSDGPMTAATAPSWPDVPFDLVCTDGANTCTGQFSPGFFTRKRLTGITTQVLAGGTYTDVDAWALGQSFPDPGDGTSAGLWLDAVTHTGKVGGTATMPAVTFDGLQLPNRVDGDHDLAPPIVKPRISNVRVESGGIVSVTYSAPECVAGGTMPTAVDTNDKRCFPMHYTPPGASDPEAAPHYFNKYVVTRLSEDDVTGGSPPVVTSYDYLGAPAWHFDDNELARPKLRTWSDWRGYGQVQVRTGTGADQSAGTSLYLRGMDGDRLLNGGTRSAVVTDSQGGTVTDSERLKGYLREQRTLNGPGGAEVDGLVNEPWLSAPTATDATHTARLLGTQQVRSRRTVTGGAQQRSEVTTAHDPVYGLPTQVDDAGDLAVADDQRCTRTEYARNPALGLVDLVSRTETVSVGCAATPARPADVVTDVRSSYDELGWGATPTRGDLTRTEQLTGYPGGTPAYTTKARLTYDVHGRTLDAYDAFDAADRKTSTSYTPATGGPVTAVTTTNALGHTNTTTLDPARGLPLTELDANGRTTELAYDPLGRLTAVWMPNRPRATVPTAPTLRFSYLLRKTAPTTVTTETLQASSQSGGTYSRTVQLFDGLLRPRQSQSQAPLQPGSSAPGRVLSDTRYDARGLVVTRNGPYYNSNGVGSDLLDVADNAMPAQTVITYDGAGRATREQFRSLGADRPGWVGTTVHDGDRTTTTPPDGGTRTTTVTDVRGRTTELWNWRTATAYDRTRYQYTPADQLSAVTDPAGNTWTYTYDQRQRLTGSTDPDRGTSTRTYDDADQLLTTTEGRNRTLAYTYDKLGRRIEMRDNSTTGPLRAAWTYDTLPNGTQVKGKAATATRYDNGNAYAQAVTGYDSLYRPTGGTVTVPAAEGALAGTYPTAMRYADNGALRGIDLPRAGDLAPETVTYSYDALGLPVQMTGASSYVGDTVYGPFGAVSQYVMGASPSRQTASTYWHDEATQRLSRATYDRLNVQPTEADLNYNYDPVGNLTRVADTPAGGTAGTECFAYDTLRRLVEAWTATDACAGAPAQARVGGPSPYWTSFAYDATGNRTSRVDHAATGDTTATSTYVATGQPKPHAVRNVATTGPAGTRTDTFAYDAAGNTVNRSLSGQPAQTLAWDPEGRLRSVTSTAGTTSYLYGPDGERLIRRDPTGTTLYLDGAELRLPKTAGSPVTGTRYYSMSDTTVAVRTAAGLHSLFSDPHGTAELSVDNADNAVTRRRSGPFGDERGTQPTAWPGTQGFLGGTKDPTGLTHLGAREYDPARGRFVSPDPLVDHGDPQSVNGYAYALNNPTTYADPTGLAVPRETGDGQDKHAVGWNTTSSTSTAGKTSGGGGGHSDARDGYYTGQKATQNALQATVNAASVRRTAAKAKVQAAAVEIVKVIVDELGITAGLDCLSSGDLSACGETAVNLLTAAAGGFAAKLLAKYGLPWEWGKAAKLGRKIFDLAGDALDGLKGWRKAGDDLRDATRARDAFDKPATQAASCSVNSFTGDTPVLLADGTSRPISQVKVGDRVLATDPQTGQTANRPVTELIRHTGPHTMVDLTLADGTVLHATDRHPIWEGTDDTFTYAKDLHPGDLLQRSDGTLLNLNKVIVRQRNLTAYNLAIAGIHTYYAGYTPVLVHNSCKLGAHGTQVTSKTLTPPGRPYRVDVENPAPGVRAGQLHLQAGSEKYLYDFTTSEFVGVPNSLARQLARDPSIARAVEKGRIYLGPECPACSAP